MYHEKYRPIEAPYAWTGAQMQKSSEWLRAFKRDELAEIDAALQAVKKSGIDLFDIDRDHFPLPTFSKELAKLGQELENGRGMVMLRGLPLSYSPEDLQIVYWGLGAHLGTAVSQNKDGELFGIVKDFRENRDDTRKRGSKSNDGLDFHSDRCDVVGLLCVRKAKSGGVSRIVSSAAIHNEVLRRRPDLMDVFYDPELCHSWQGEEPPGYPRYYKRPIFGYRDGHFTGMFSPLYTRSAQQYPEVPRLTERQREALTCLRSWLTSLRSRCISSPAIFSSSTITSSTTPARISKTMRRRAGNACFCACGSRLPATARCRKATKSSTARRRPERFAVACRAAKAFGAT